MVAPLVGAGETLFSGAGFAATQDLNWERKSSLNKTDAFIPPEATAAKVFPPQQPPKVLT